MTTAVPAAVLDRLRMLAPQDVPSQGSVAEWADEMSVAGLYRKDGLDASLLARDVSNVEVAVRLEQMLRAIPAAARVADGDRKAEDDLAHDAYFHIERVGGCAPAVFARMAVSARLILLKDVAEMPVTIARSLLETVDRALADLGGCVLSDGMEGTRYVSLWQMHGSAAQPMARWVHGHQIFAALSQGLIFSFQSLGRAIRMENREEIRRWAGLSISLLAGSGAAFVLTGDFSEREYNEIVRPSMMPPASPMNLSGLMSADHRFLMQTIQAMRPALRALHEQEPDLHDRLKQEMSTVYDRHIHVCERFVGERPSLLTARHAKKSGPALIEQFKTLRMKAFDSPAHAARLRSECATRPFVGKGLEEGSLVEAPAHTEEIAVESCPKDYERQGIMNVKGL